MPISYADRDVLLYAVGIGTTDLRFAFEKHPSFAVFPTFPIRWGGTGSVPDANALPPSPGPLMLDAERFIERLTPLPPSGTVLVRSRLLSVHPRGKGNAFVEKESEVTDGRGVICIRMISGTCRRARPISRRRHSFRPTRRISTVSRATIIPCMSTLRRRASAASAHRFCMGCVRMDIVGRCCLPRCAAVMPIASRR